MKKLSLALVTVFCLGTAPGLLAAANGGAPGAAGGAAQPFRCASQKHLVSMTVNDSGRTAEGPVCAELHVNVLRYVVTLGTTYATPTAGPTLSSAFPTAFQPGSGQQAAPTNLADQFNEYQSMANQIFRGWIVQESDDRTQAASLAHDLLALQNVIIVSDEAFNLRQGAGVLSLLQDPNIQAILGKVGTYQDAWKTSDDVLKQLQILQEAVNMLPLKYPADTGTLTGDACSTANAKLLGWINWDKCNDSAYKLLQSTLTSALTDANLWASDSDKTMQFIKSIGILEYWQRRIAQLKSPDVFVLQQEIPCGVLFNQNQPISWKVTTTDQTGTFPGQTAQQPVPSTPLNVTCSSAFAVSAGAGFSLIKNPTYAIVQGPPPTGSTTPTATFGVTSNSPVNPYPLVLAHARLMDWTDNRYALHYAFGAGVNPSGGSTGTNPEFLTGLSFSFYRTIFVTGGLDIGKQVSLAGGFHLGDTVPLGVTTVPTSNSYTPAFGFAITFTKP